MLNQNFVILGAFINLLGGISYISDTIKGKVKPNKVSWGLWALAPIIASVAEVTQGVGITALMTFMVGFVPLLIFLASFINKKSYWKLGKFDIFCAILSLVGLVLWYITKVGNIAIAFSLFSDFMAGIPTLIKSFTNPETESYWEFASSFISSILTMLTFRVWNFQTYAFPIWIFLFDFVAICLIKFKLGKKISFNLRRTHH